MQLSWKNELKPESRARFLVIPLFAHNELHLNTEGKITEVYGKEKNIGI